MIIGRGCNRQRFQASAEPQRDREADSFIDPIEALTASREDTYALAIVDIRMPTRDGFQVYRELKARYPGLPVSFVTAFDVHDGEFQRLFPHLKI